MNKSVAYVENWMTERSSNLGFSLKNPVDSNTIELFKNVSKEKIPGALLDLYKCFNGQDFHSNNGIFYGLTFMPMENVIENIENMEIATCRDIPLSEVDTKGRIKEYDYHPKWIPFAENHGGSYLGMDYDPGDQGIKGQIINFGMSEHYKYVLADSFELFLKWYVEQLENENYYIGDSDAVFDDGPGLIYGIKEPRADFLNNLVLDKYFK